MDTTVVASMLVTHENRAFTFSNSAVFIHNQNIRISGGFRIGELGLCMIKLVETILKGWFKFSFNYTFQINFINFNHKKVPIKNRHYLPLHARNV